VREGDDLVDVVSKYQGQGVLNLLSLGTVQEQVDAAIVELRPGDEPVAGGGAPRAVAAPL
jgi:hypothetical protein